MNHEQGPTVLIVRGAGPAGRRIATTLHDAGATPVVLDERTCAHESVHALRVPFGDVARPRRAVHGVGSRYGRLDAMVLLPAATSTVGAAVGAPWDLELGHEMTLVAGLVRSAAPMLARSSGVVIPVSSPTGRHAPTDPAVLTARACGPVIDALGQEFGFRVVPVDTATSGTSRGMAVGEVVVEQLRAATAASAGVR